MGLTWFCPCLYYLWCMLNIGSGPSSFRTGDTKNTFRLFWIPFCAGIENPFEPHIPTGITDHVTWNFHSFARGHTINILLIWPTERLIWKERKKGFYVLYSRVFTVCTSDFFEEWNKFTPQIHIRKFEEQMAWGRVPCWGSFLTSTGSSLIQRTLLML